jgi:hypothetical protein
VRLFIRSPDAPESVPLVLNIPGSKDLTKKIGDIGTGPYDTFFKLGKPAEGTDNPLLDFYQHSHIENPEYNISHRDSHSYAKGMCINLYVCMNVDFNIEVFKLTCTISHMETPIHMRMVCTYLYI